VFRIVIALLRFSFEFPSYNAPVEFGIPMKLEILIKMCRNETYSSIRAGKHLSDINTCVSYIPSNTTVIVVSVLFYHGYMFRRLIGPSSGYSGGTLLLSIYLHFHCNYCTVIRDLFHLYSFGL
jgi:hypothetical protein